MEADWLVIGQANRELLCCCWGQFFTPPSPPFSSSAHLLLFLSGSFLSPLTLHHLLLLLHSLPPSCLFICLLVNLSVHRLLSSLLPSLPLSQSHSVTGEFPELITGGYPRVQRGPAHLQAEGAGEGCLITFSTAWLKTAHKSLVHMGLCTHTRIYIRTHTHKHTHSLK